MVAYMVAYIIPYLHTASDINLKEGRSGNEAARVGTLALVQDQVKLISSHGQITTGLMPRPSYM